MLAKLSGLYYGWRMVGVASALRVLGAGLHSFGFTVFFLPLSQDLNINRTATSLAFSLARAEGAIEGPIVGHLLDRYGPKPIMLTAALLMGIGYLILSQVDSYASFLVVYLGIISLVHAGGFMHAPMVLINTWFIRQRARAITLNSAAFGLGGVLIAPLLSLVVQAWGWRWGAVVAGMTFLVVGLPICLDHTPLTGEHGTVARRRRAAGRAGKRRPRRPSAARRVGSHPRSSIALVRLLGLGTGQRRAQRVLPRGVRPFHSADDLERTEPAGSALGC